MNLGDSDEYNAFRAEVRRFLKSWPLQGDEARLPREGQEALFRQRGIEAGYVYRNIPRSFGGAGQEPDARKDAIVLEDRQTSPAP